MTNQPRPSCCRLFFLLLLVIGVSPAAAQPDTIALTEEMVNASNRFITTLSGLQKNNGLFAFASEERLNWHFIPRPRKGIPYSSMTEEQRQSARELLQVFFSPAGFAKTESVRSLERVLAEIEVNGRFVRDPDLYYFSFFGEPSMESPWAFRYEGHHLAFNWTFAAGQGVASSPQFFGSNPAEVRSGDRIGTRVLAAEEDLARELLDSFDAAQLGMAVVDTAAPRDIITGAQVDIEPLEQQGITYQQLDSSQKLALIRLIEEIAAAQPPAIAEARMQKIRNGALNELRFLWIGSRERGEGHYYRIQGAGILIEYDNTQNNNNHIHLVWRDFADDFGRDLLRQHYQEVAAVYGPGHQH